MFMTNFPKDIVVLDDHHLFVEGVLNMLCSFDHGIDVEAFNSIKSLKLNNGVNSSTQLLISDIEIPNEDTLLWLSSVKNEYPDLKILVISMHNKLSVLKRCQKIGIEGFLLKDDATSLIEVVSQLWDKGAYLSTKCQEVLNLVEKEVAFLTPKEKRVLQLLAEGMSNKEIAETMFVSYNTIKTHRRNLGVKLNLNSSQELVKYYYKNHLA